MFTFPFSLFKELGFFNTFSTAFDGSDDTATVSPSADLAADITTNLTVALWVKGSPANNAGVLTHYTNTGNQRKWAVFVGVGGIDFRIILSSTGSDTPKDIRSNVDPFDDAWHLIGFSYDGGAATASQLKLYTDGVVAPSPILAADSACTSLHNSTTDVVLGRFQGGTHYAGNIDEATVWDVTFSATDWTNLYNSGVPNDPKTHAKSANLVSLWRMGDGDTHPTITDNQGSNNLTMNNMTAGDFESDTP